MTLEHRRPVPDLVRDDFITAYREKWNVTREYADDLMGHVETGAGEDVLADFYQQLCHMHTGMLLMHGSKMAQGLTVAIVEIQKLIPEEKKQAAVARWAERTAQVPGIEETG